MWKKLRGGRRQILQLEEKKPPKAKPKVKSLIHHSDSDDDSKKSNESEFSPTSTVAQNKEVTPLESKIADFFKEIDALSVPDELFEKPDEATSISNADTVNENISEACSSGIAFSLPVSTNTESNHSNALSEEVSCQWQEICDNTTGYNYFWNMQTNEVTWDCPPEYAAYVQSLNASTEKITNTAQIDKNIENKEIKKKKNDIVVPAGAALPISYFGNSTTSDVSSEVESELSNKNAKSRKVSEGKKIHSTCEVQGSETMGPSHFRYPLTDSVAKETHTQMAISQNDAHGVVKIDSSLPYKTLKDIIEKSSQSDLDESPAKSIHETSGKNSLKDAEKKCVNLNEKAGVSSPDSTMINEERSHCYNPYEVRNSTYGFRSVVEYDTFTDEEEEIYVTDISSSKSNSDGKKSENKSSKAQNQKYTLKSTELPFKMNNFEKEAEALKENTKKEELVQKFKKNVVNVHSFFAPHSPDQQEQENVIESSTSSKLCFGYYDCTTSDFKRQSPEVLKENSEKEELIKRPKRNDVNIDTLFASNSSFGKYGFGFAREKQLDEKNGELFTNTQNNKTHKHQREFKSVSFVKSRDILDLKELNDEMVHGLLSESVQANAEYNQSNVLEQNKKTLQNNEELPKITPVKQSIKNSSDYGIDSSSIISIKDKIDFSSLSKKRKNGKFPFKADSISLKVEDDLDEIDKALCEALEAKKSAKNASVKSSSPISDALNASKSMQKSTTSLGKHKDANPGCKNAIDSKADDILEISSVLIEKITFLLSASSTQSSFNEVFFQLQTRLLDWQRGALDSTYFMARLKELEQYIQHYEANVISGEWTYKWDRINKRYFFNKRTERSEWTYPEECCCQEESSCVLPQDKAAPSAASSFAPDGDFHQVKSSSSTMLENSAHDQVKSSSSTMLENSAHEMSPSFSLESKDNSSGLRWNEQPSPPLPAPPPGSEPPPLPPHTPPPKSPPPPPPDSTDTLLEPEDMDIEYTNDSSSFLFVNNIPFDDKRIQFLSEVEQSLLRPPVSFASASNYTGVSSTSVSACEDLCTVSKLSQSIPHSIGNSDMTGVHWFQPSLSSEAKINTDSTKSTPVVTDIPATLSEEQISDTNASSSNEVCSSQPDSLHLKQVKPGNALSKKEKKKTKIQPGLGMKKKNLPFLVKKWQKIKDEQNKEDNETDEGKTADSF